MERIIKTIFCILILFLSAYPAFADTQPAAANSTLVAPQLITLPQCIKTFNVGYEKLFLLTEAAVAQNNFNVEEIQTQGGYIVFSVYSRKYLATVFTFGANKAILKITPCDNNYNFSPTIIRNIFRYIETNQYKKF